LIRIPASRGENTRIELRSPDPTANPYMLFAVCLAAGLDGIKNNLIPEESIDNNIFEMSEKERKELGIDKLPENLNDAIDEFEKDELMKSVLGEDISSNYINAKRQECLAYRTQVTEWEIEQYLHKF
jgi:glutamine synthetase